MGSFIQFWMFAILIIIAALSGGGCAMQAPLNKTTTTFGPDGKTATQTVSEQRAAPLFGGGDYDTYGDMYNGWNKGRTDRTIAITGILCPDAQTQPVANAWCQASKMMGLDHISSERFDMTEPTTFMKGLSHGVDRVVPVTAVLSFVKFGEAAVNKAGNITFNGPATVSDSFKNPIQTQIGQGQTLFGTQPYQSPLVVQPDVFTLPAGTLPAGTLPAVATP